MKHEEGMTPAWTREHPAEDALLTAEIREMVGTREMMVDCGMLGPVPIVPPAVKRRRDDPNP